MLKMMVRVILLFVVLGLLAAGLYFLIKRNEKPVEVFATRTVETGTIINKAVATGSIEPRREVTIKSRVSGVLEKLHVEAGATIEREDLIAKIRVVPDAVTLNAAQARVETARISVQSARRERDRRRSLLKEKLISKDEYATYQYEYEIASEEQSSAQNNLTLIREGGSGESGSVSSEIRSTVRGTVLQMPVKEGETVTETNTFNEGTTIAAVADMTDMIFNGTVDESEVGRIKEGLPLLISIGAIENETFDGVLEFISPKGVSEEGDDTVQFEIRAAITASSENTIRAGYSANADIVLDRRDDVLTLDEGALIFDQDKVFVLLKNGEEFERREVKTGLSDGLKIEILDGLDDGATVRIP